MGVIFYLIGLILIAGCSLPPAIFKKKKIWTIIGLFVSFAFMWFLCTFKSLNIGNDTIKYYNSYLESKDPSLIKSARDIGFGVFKFVCAKLHLPWLVFLGFCNIPLYFGAALFAYKRTPYPTFIAFFVYTFLLFEFSLSGLRQSMSVGFLLIGMAFFKKEKWYSWIVYFVFNLISILFHKSSIVMIIYPFLSLLTLTKISILFFTLILLLFTLYVSQIESFAFYLVSYLEYYPNNASSNYTLIFIITLTLVLILVSLFDFKILAWLNDIFDKISPRFLKRENVQGNIDLSENQVAFKNSFFQTLPLHIFLIIGLFSNTTVRGYYYSVVSFAAWISYFIWSQKSKSFRIVLVLGFMFVFGLYFCFSFLRRSNCVPYEFYF